MFIYTYISTYLYKFFINTWWHKKVPTPSHFEHTRSKMCVLRIKSYIINRVDHGRVRASPSAVRSSLADRNVNDCEALSMPTNIANTVYRVRANESCSPANRCSFSILRFNGMVLSIFCSFCYCSDK